MLIEGEVNTVDKTPTSDEFRPAVLRVLNDDQERTIVQIRAQVADYVGLSEQIRAERIPSGQPRFENRINWACSALKFAGLVERVSRGRYRITADGHTVDARNLDSYSENDLMEWDTWKAYKDEIAARKPDASGDNSLSVDEVAEPIEVMSTAERSFNAQTETDLRKRLQDSSPGFFEKAVIDVLWAMGYGGAHGEKQRVGRSGDGGIDGVIRQDALGLTSIYIQAKRYADTNKVGDPEIRTFIGSLDSRGANLGVFITTSSFQPAAQRTADNYRHGKIVLIDGIKLTSLMLAYGVGVRKTREFSLFEVDDDFFDEELG
ncbi:restriction endonuclease [Mobiluncus mulieris]|uniref:Restriction endonuclease n=1 Tax=Mobiluncus mulieris TaxID=2052 RepID=A0A7Y0U129_9ACTO|nr:restriction endonuclease [Mobiluncus mulieris]MCU9995653.1 restriction endonuclease [Mobiluncus mulieris]NMW65006.1 restriction endonuclease [Mobiluncus mulieris]NMW80912.1 restriction endonuclease [Mobiluncus mulieris]